MPQIVRETRGYHPKRVPLVGYTQLALVRSVTLSIRIVWLQMVPCVAEKTAVLSND